MKRAILNSSMGAARSAVTRRVVDIVVDRVGDDAMKILSEQTKKQLTKVFEDWATGGDETPPADLAVSRF